MERYNNCVLRAVFALAALTTCTTTVEAQSAFQGPATPGSLHPQVVSTGGKGFKESGIPIPIPSLNVHGVTASAPATAGDPKSIHEGVFSNGFDLSQKPLPGDPSVGLPCSDPANSFCSWILAHTSTPHASTPDYPMVLGQAISDAKGELSKLNPGVLKDALQILKTLAGGDSSNVRFAADNQPISRFVGYAPDLGRWLKEQDFHFIGGILPYSDPLVMANLRERGARLYCAAREAQNNHQNANTKSMGKLTAFSVKLFGKDIDFLTIEPTLVIDGPQPYLGGDPRCPIDPTQNCSGGSPNDGAQSFMVPFLIGTQITPVSLLPSLPEIQVPVVMISGDSEIVTPASDRDVSKTYQTVTHTDAILSSEVTGAAASTTLLYTLGPVQIFMDLGMGYGVGQLFSNESIGTPDTSLATLNVPPPPGMVNPLPNDRVLDNSPFGLAARSGGFDGFADDSAWRAPAGFTADTSANQSIATEPNNNPPIAPLHFTLQPFNPFLVRALQADDRLVWNSTTLGLQGGVHGELPTHFDIGFGGFSGSIDAVVSAGGKVQADAAMRHTLRDAALFIPQDAPPPAGEPISAVTIVPSVSADAKLDLNVGLRLTAVIDVFGFKREVTIFDAPILDTGLITIDHYDSGPWPEENRFRLGTGSTSGDPLKAPLVSSHFPNGGLFASFPAGNDVDSCLANPASNTPPPPPCAPQPPAVTTPPSGQMCVYAGGSPNAPPLPLNVCSNIEGYVGTALPPPATDAQRQCLIQKFRFLCQPVSQTQNFQGAEVVSHIFNPEDQNEMTEIHNIVQQCVQANPKRSPDAVARSLFSFGVCTGTATLLTSSQVASGAGSPVVNPGTCH
jgi:hypothetical protein